ncbi:hypothetical protein AKJ51_02060 [candidate division MSBL1 archaeon SCGC-AAA382A20]|uniref:N-acetyltransferase domain-containing protein n=2 Tax=candidate division MSBL1 TaxID=215777 RepID=A0A133VKX5_9EURY|nr:hypothetical protein AKJ50_01670 [candidate division MSBL1 archaeon SCGC-AAA382A13]KXB07083.1 hypothetical protein AKJ51_02060 [candidate division MSBL1 archaeon SCGC-AAA382A20]
MEIDQKNQEEKCVYEVWNDYRTHIIGTATINKTLQHKKLKNINIHRQRRSKGIGSKLLQRIISDHADSTIVAWVFNERVDWYKRHGFTTDEESENLVKVVKPSQ